MLVPPVQTTEVPIVLELFALDTVTCEPCVSAMSSLHAAAAVLSRELTDQGYLVATRVVLLENAARAGQLGISSSPTVRVNGHDVALEIQEEPCSTCSSLAGTGIECRTYTWDGQRFDHPPVPLLVDAVHRHVASGARRASRQTPAASQPTSVERFFVARDSAC